MNAAKPTKNLKMFGESRLARSLSPGADRGDARSSARTLGQPAAHQRMLSLPAASCMGHPSRQSRSWKPEKRYPGLERVLVEEWAGVPQSVCLEQVESFATEVMPAFHIERTKMPALT